jgi:hypothetical protein
MCVCVGGKGLIIPFFWAQELGLYTSSSIPGPFPIFMYTTLITHPREIRGLPLPQEPVTPAQCTARTHGRGVLARALSPISFPRILPAVGSDVHHEVTGIQDPLVGCFSVCLEGLANEVLALLSYLRQAQIKLQEGLLVRHAFQELLPTVLWRRKKRIILYYPEHTLTFAYKCD